MGESVSNVRAFNEAYTDTFTHSMDAKGRTIVPSEWRRENYANRLCLVPSEDKCLKIYPADLMADKMRQLADAPVNDPRRKVMERLASIIQSVSIDAQGRIMIKESLRKHAGLKSAVLFRGCYDHFQIWDPERAKETGSEEMTWEQVAREVGL